MGRLLLYAFLLIIIANPIYAISLGVSPASITFEEMLRGGYAERSVTVTTNSVDELTGHFTVSGNIASWLRFEQNSTRFNLSSSSPYRLTIIVEPPDDAASGTYIGKITFNTDRVGSLTGRAGGLVKAAVMLSINVDVTDTEITECQAGAFSFSDIETGYPLELAYTIINDGNVRIKPLLEFDIWDQFQETIVLSEEVTSGEVLPTREQRFVQTIPDKDLDIGQYWVKMAVDECESEGLLTFSVVEKGAIVDKGSLEKIVNKPWVYVGERVEIVAVFKNTGPRVVTAKFMGNIKLDDKIVEVIETEEVDVNSEESVELRHYFTPDDSGRYVVSGRVAYNKKLTYEKGSIINTNYGPEDKRRFNIYVLIIYLIIVITIIFILRKIMKKRRNLRGQ